MYKYLALMLVTIYTCFSLVLPVLFVNKLVFMLMLVMLFIGVVFGNVKVITFSPFLIIIIFLYSFLISMTTGVAEGLRQQLMLVCLSLLLIYYIKYTDVCMDSVALFSGVVLSLSTLILFLSVVFEIDSLQTVFDNYGSIAAGSRDVGNGVQDFYRLGGLPFLFISFSVVVRNLSLKFDFWNVFYFFLISFFIILSSTRSVLVGCILILFFMFGRKHIILSIYLLFIALAYLLVKFDPAGGFFDTNDFGNAIKIKDALSFLDWANVTNILFGEGLASLYYSGGRGYFVAQTEITLLDNIRYFGLILTIVFYSAILFPNYKKLAYKVDGGFYFAVMFIYILMSMTNPMLVNSFGFIVVLWYWSNVLNVK
ncbi:hypothetical protein [Shewanella pneumatophori]|uniref:Uncharacterized protein n=1 Tax=Shewanella pneumatophori TaxID=314092 RepID=A0A9X2CIE7_9GAMM|nr:hypothetical protein [Shewanella pneumatophori]MCL1139580.1 hypothetical protein [Shewanella pneumatophori]